jgi:hypothetical protein
VTTPADQTRPPNSESQPTILLWAIGPGFVLIAAWMMLGPSKAPIPMIGSAPVARAAFAPSPRKLLLGDPPTILIGGFEHTCNECHKLLTPPAQEHTPLMQHTEIALNHGINNRCFNCHDRSNRDRLALHDGTLVSFNQVPRLCAECHGTVYRDWQAGTHGKTMGSWDAASGNQHRLGCNECHDPHSPAYKPIAPLPGPNTLRMGDQTRVEEPPRHHAPLRRWLRPDVGPPLPPKTPQEETHP